MDICFNTNEKIKITPRLLLLFNFIFIMLCNMSNLQFRLSVDGYAKLVYNNNHAFYLKDARVLSALLNIIFRWLPAVKFQKFYFFVFIASISLCINIFISICAKFIKIDSLKKLLFIDLAFVFGFVNTLMQEYSLFPEDYLAYGTGLILICMSIKSFFLENSLKKRAILTSLYLILALFCYQLFIEAWLIFLAIFLLLKHDNCLSIEFFGDILLISIIFVASMFILICAIEFMINRELVDSARNIIIKWKKNLFNIKSICRCIKTFFKKPIHSLVGIMIYTMLSVFICEIVFLFAKLCMGKIRFIDFWWPNILLIFSVLATFGIQVFMRFVWLPPRVLTGIGFLTCALLIYLIRFIDNKHINFFILFVGILFFINVYFSQSIAINQYATNRIDQEQVCNICYRIRDYEDENKIKIKKIAFCQDPYPTLGYYGNTKYIAWDLNIREFLVKWGQIEIINYYAKRNFEKIDMTEDIYKKYFIGKKWDYYKPEEQLIFVDDTLYICIY